MRDVLRGVGLIGALLVSGCTAEAAPEPAEHHPLVTNLVATMMRYQHYSPKAIDDELSAVWLDAYVEALDPNHMIFLQSDIDGFQRYADKLDDDILSREPTLSAAEAIYARYQERLGERIVAAQAVLAEPIDLSVDEMWRPDRSGLEWPGTDAEATELWRKRVKNEVLIRELSAPTEGEAARSRADIQEGLVKRYDRIRSDAMAADGADMLETYLGAFTRSFDPHSAYFKPATNDNFNIDISNSLEGIGARLRVDGEYTVVEGIVPGGPADQDGDLQPGDRIIAVAQGAAAPEDVVGMRLDKVVQQIRGKKGTEVRLTVIPVDEPDQTAIVDITRDKVLLEESDADGQIIEIDGRKLGWIEVPSFYVDPRRRAPHSNAHGAADDVRSLTEQLQGEGMEGLILDLRGNGGGSLNEAVEMAGLFIDRGPVVQVKGNEGDPEVLRDPDPRTVYDGPIVVLTDPLSASASEIVAGALQDYGRAVVVGAETTHGKGTVQQLIDLDRFVAQLQGGATSGRSGALKLTTQKFYRVSGGSTQNRGVRSDIVLPSFWDGLDVYESDLENALSYDEIERARYSSVAELSGLMDTLRERSAARVAESEGFSELSAMLDRRDSEEDKVEFSLNIETRRARLKAEEAQDPEPETEDAAESDGVDPSKDFILQEAGAVLLDWLSLSGS